MPEMSLQRIPFSEDADKRLRMLKARTGITPNILCRIGFCLSLEEPGKPAISRSDINQGREINRYTLLGKYDSLFIGLLATRMMDDLIPISELESLFLAHMHRGVEILAARTKSLSDLASIVPNLAD